MKYINDFWMVEKVYAIVLRNKWLDKKEHTPPILRRRYKSLMISQVN